jgi:hypothetical protein
MLRGREGLTKSVAFLKSVAPSEASDYARRSSEAPRGAAAGSGRAPFGGRGGRPWARAPQGHPRDPFWKIWPRDPRRPEPRPTGAN